MSANRNEICLLNSYPTDRARQVVGLISGTSADGIDAALVEFPPVQAAEQKLRVVDFVSAPYPVEVREKVYAAAADALTVREVARLNTRIGELFADAALQVLDGRPCDLIGSHGQTICHLPEEATTLQIGESNLIASKTRTTTISDFRTADMALGGQGAPLVPLLDAHILSSPDIYRVAINLGGIANLTVIPSGSSSAASLRAWDTGPANSLSDALCRLAGVGNYDKGGAIAASGNVLESLLNRLLANPYFQLSAPKSTGLEDFGEILAQEIVGLGELPDVVRTVIALSAQTLVNDLLDLREAADNCGEFELVFAGGGTANQVLMAEIRSRLEQELTKRAWPLAKFSSFADFGIPEEAREAVAFAYLADRTARGQVGSAPTITGAERACVLGKVSFP